LNLSDYLDTGIIAEIEEFIQENPEHITIKNLNQIFNGTIPSI
jgi:hypothetical protein